MIQVVTARLQHFLYKLFFHLREEGIELQQNRALRVMPGGPGLQAGFKRSATYGARQGGSCCSGKTDGRIGGLSKAQTLGYRRGTVQILKHRPLPTNCGRHCIQQFPVLSPFVYL
jgi:hypothetical protein